MLKVTRVKRVLLKPYTLVRLKGLLQYEARNRRDVGMGASEYCAVRNRPAINTLQGGIHIIYMLRNKGSEISSHRQTCVLMYTLTKCLREGDPVNNA